MSSLQAKDAVKGQQPSCDNSKLSSSVYFLALKRLGTLVCRWLGALGEVSLRTLFGKRCGRPDRDLLIVTSDHITPRRIGVAMRHWEMAEALAKEGLRVTLASGFPIPPGVVPRGFELVDLSRAPRKALELAERHAVILAHGAVRIELPALKFCRRPLVCDMVTPVHVENLQASCLHHRFAMAMINDGLSSGDFLICGNERQRLYWLGMLTAQGRVTRSRASVDANFRGLIDVVGFGLPEEDPLKTRPALRGVRPGIGADDFVLLWFGGIWDWLNPLPLVHAVHQAHARDPRIKLVFSMLRRDPDDAPSRMAQQTLDLARELDALEKSVFFNEYPIPFADRADYLLECDMGVILQADNLETELSARTRALDYLWADLPLLINRGDDMADLAARHGLGVVPDTCDPDELAKRLLEYAGCPERQQAARQAIRAIKDRFRWRTVLRPLVDFCRRHAVS
jgi:glycosyltransferase involved in cell wall biosynthesis